jgi:hypothetical protein
MEGYASESSLPTTHVNPSQSSPQLIPYIRSSPPVNIETMDNGGSLKSEAPSTQNETIQKPPLKRLGSDDTERPPSAQQHADGSDYVDDDDDEEEEEELESDPAEKLIDFDWESLMQRYHDAMQVCHDEEGQLMQEWESLMNV